MQHGHVKDSNIHHKVQETAVKAKKHLRASAGTENNRLASSAFAGITSQTLHHLVGCDAHSRQVTPLQPVRFALNDMDAARAQVG